MIKLVASHRDAGGELWRASRDTRWCWDTDVPRLLSTALWRAAPVWWNRADGERMRRSCMPSSPSLAEGDIWHHLAHVHYWGQKKCCLFPFLLFIAAWFKVVDGRYCEWFNSPPSPIACSQTHTPSRYSSWSLSPSPSIKVNRGFQQWANEHGPLSRDACLCCLPPRTPLVYLGCQVKGRLREGETFFFFFNKDILVSIETAGQHYRDNDRTVVSGHPTVCPIVIGNTCVYVREMKQLFKLFPQDAPQTCAFYCGSWD